MAIRGQRFRVNFDDDLTDHTPSSQSPPSTNFAGLSFITDVKERVPSVARAPSPPKVKKSATGFPPHEKRTNRPVPRQKQDVFIEGGSATQAEDTSNAELNALSTTQSRGKNVNMESESIDMENEQRLAQMSSEEIEKERQELMAALSPSLIERLLRKANIDEGRTDLDNRLDDPKPGFINSPAQPHPRDQKPDPNHTDPDGAPIIPPSDLQPASFSPVFAPPIHFPNLPEPPSLDPSDPNFLENLHTKYFPSLPADPSKLAWMAPLPIDSSSADQSSPYHPSKSEYPTSALRFDFRGHLLPPRLARQIPSSKGLHHHGDAPEAAGYTIPELAHLARSSYAAQRCIAFQTLGRILYRLGRGDFGDEREDLSQGLWRCVEEGQVIDGMVKEAGKADGEGNRSIRVTATEAVWLWRKGGGRRWKAQ